MNLQKVDEIVDKFNGEKGYLIQILQDVQSEYNWLPKETIVRVCEKLGISLTQAYSIATFYTTFSLEPRGKHLVNVCMGTACHVRGGPKVLEKVEQTLNIKAGQTTPDLAYSLEKVNCLGCCALGPVMVVDNDAHGKLAISKIAEIIAGYK